MSYIPSNCLFHNQLFNEIVFSLIFHCMMLFKEFSSIPPSFMIINYFLENFKSFYLSYFFVLKCHESIRDKKRMIN